MRVFCLLPGDGSFRSVVFHWAQVYVPPRFMRRVALDVATTAQAYVADPHARRGAAKPPYATDFVERGNGRGGPVPLVRRVIAEDSRSIGQLRLNRPRNPRNGGRCAFSCERVDRQLRDNRGGSTQDRGRLRPCHGRFDSGEIKPDVACLLKPLQEYHRAALPAYGRLGPLAVTDIFPLCVVIAEAPQVRRLHMRVVQAISPAVEALEQVGQVFGRPVRDLGEPVIFQRVDSALLPGEWRIARSRPPGGHVYGARR